MCWMRSWATRPTYRSPSTPLTPTAPACSASPWSTLVGLQLSPRIRDLDKITLYRAGTRADTCAQFLRSEPLLTRKINIALIAEHWDEMLRLAASLKDGHVTDSLIVGKLSRADRQNTLAAALKEYRALRRTIYAARYLWGGLPPQDLPPAQQGREHPCAAPRGVLRP
jgi:hypothetical protein